MAALFITFLVLWILLSSFLLVFSLLYEKREVRKFDSRVYKAVISLANSNDYLLINSVQFTDKFDRTYKADYFLIADKFCYVINEQQISGVLDGVQSDKYLINYTTDEKEEEIENIFLTNKKNALGFDSFINEKTIIDCEYVIPITVVPNNLSLSPSLTPSYKNSYVLKLKNLKKGILTIEAKSDIKPISNTSIKSIKQHILALVQQKEESNEAVKSN